MIYINNTSNELMQIPARCVPSAGDEYTIRLYEGATLKEHSLSATEQGGDRLHHVVTVNATSLPNGYFHYILLDSDLVEIANGLLRVGEAVAEVESYGTTITYKQYGD